MDLPRSSAWISTSRLYAARRHAGSGRRRGRPHPHGFQLVVHCEYSRRVATKSGSIKSLNVSIRWGCKWKARQMCCTLVASVRASSVRPGDLDSSDLYPLRDKPPAPVADCRFDQPNLPPLPCSACLPRRSERSGLSTPGLGSSCGVPPTPSAQSVLHRLGSGMQVAALSNARSPLSPTTWHSDATLTRI
ncbi:hypothetical protein FBZ93_1274 [Bradyrhizobium macuxiense]|uniref:Uncharacterized protein n=1 Tax=Bradyrhizobium macuxiense TaxID=1755647 RepID=A0A560L0T0_9BRAD|nr:hypothetical protein FBZ93_1274 [Bradyrhizobium macuxiense]